MPGGHDALSRAPSFVETTVMKGPRARGNSIISRPEPADPANMRLRKRIFTECRRSLRKKYFCRGFLLFDYCFIHFFFGTASVTERRTSEALSKNSRSRGELNNTEI